MSFMGYSPWYYQTIRRIVMTFGTIFKDLQCVKYDANTRVEISRTTVPLDYAGKETFVTRLFSDPTLQKGVQVVLPAMSFEMTTIKLDIARKTTPYQKQALTVTGNNATLAFTHAVPYDVGINLYLYARNQEDATQIVERILPFFSPDYTMSVNYLMTPEINVSEDLPFVLENIEYNNNYEGPAGTERMILWTLQFNAKAWFYGPMANAALITQATANIHNMDANNIVSTVVVTPNSNTIITSSDYGFTISITEQK